MLLLDRENNEFKCFRVKAVYYIRKLNRVSFDTLFKDFSSRKQHCRGLEEKFIQNHGISRNLQQTNINS